MTYEHVFVVHDTHVAMFLHCNEGGYRSQIRITVEKGNWRVRTLGVDAMDPVTAAAVGRMLQTAAELAIAMKQNEELDPSKWLTGHGYKEAK